MKIQMCPTTFNKFITTSKYYLLGKKHEHENEINNGFVEKTQTS